MPKFSRKQGLVAKVEGTSGTDAAPTGASNAMLVRNLRLGPLKQQLAERDTTKPYLGNNASIQVASWKTLEFEVEIAGAGAAGSAPKYAPLLKGCGFQETLNAGVSAVYALESGPFDSLTMWTEVDGTLHKMTYARGSVMPMLDSRSIPVFKFTFTGLFVPVVDGSISGISYTGFVTPVAVNKANSVLSLHGYTAIVDKLSIDLKNTVVYRNMYGLESVEITQRTPEGSISMEDVSVATKNWWATIAAGTSGTLSVAHGTVAGNIVEFTAPQVIIQEPDFGDVDGIRMLNAKLKFEPSAADNELVITVR